MVYSAIYCLVIMVIILPFALVRGSTELEARDESEQLPSKDMVVSEHSELPIFQANLFRTAEGSPTFGNDGQLSKQWTLNDYFEDVHECVCRSNIQHFPKYQLYSDMEERSNDKQNPYNNAASWYRDVKAYGIAASYVDSFSQKEAFIATAAPQNLVNVFCFWHMVWQQKVGVIVMLTRPTMEHGISQSAQYWPTHTWQTKQYRGNIQGMASRYIVSLEKTVVSSTAYACLRLKLYREKEFRFVTHCLFNDWPDMSIPKNTEDLLAFRSHVNYMNTADDQDTDPAAAQSLRPPPIVVHCHAGLGRTGTFIAIDVLIERMESNLDGLWVDLAGVVERLRLQRPRSILGENQYNFCITALHAYYCKRSVHKCNNVAHG